MINQCSHCGLITDSIRKYIQEVSYFRGDDEVHHLCLICYQKRLIILPQYQRKRSPKGSAYYPEKIVKLILRLAERGYRVKQLSPYQFRINETLNLFPVNLRFHNIKTGKRGNMPII